MVSIEAVLVVVVVLFVMLVARLVSRVNMHRLPEAGEEQPQQDYRQPKTVPQ